jgi:hypothetical protein
MAYPDVKNFTISLYDKLHEEYFDKLPLRKLNR